MFALGATIVVTSAVQLIRGALMAAKTEHAARIPQEFILTDIRCSDNIAIHAALARIKDAGFLYVGVRMREHHDNCNCFVTLIGYGVRDSIEQTLERVKQTCGGPNTFIVRFL